MIRLWIYTEEGRIKAIETFWNDLVMMVQGMDGSKVKMCIRDSLHVWVNPKHANKSFKHIRIVYE